MQFGDAETRDAVGFYNGEYALNGGTRLYSFGGLGYRRGEGFGFFRRASDDRTVRAPVRRRSGVIAEAVRRLDDAGVGIEDIALRRPTLDDVFIALTGHAAEEEDATEAAEAGVEVSA